MVAAQRAVAVEHPRLVTEGRDQGSVVFANAAVKFYLDATPRIRADRRAAQLRRAGQQADLEEILLAILRRDEMDMGREVAPLRCPPDAIRLDTGPLSLAETVAELVRLARSAAPRQLAVGGAT
jgi:cytidylate kinase